jgi:sec-independent protein translocase protein TatA
MFEGLFQPMHLLLIAIIAIIFFGPKRLPELGKGLGEGIRGFRDAFSGGASEKPAVPPAAPPAAPKEETKKVE